MTARLRVHTLGAVLAYVAGRGGDPATVLRAAGVPARAVAAGPVELTVAALGRAYAAAAVASRDPLLGIHIGETLSRDVWDVLQLSCLGAPDLGRALARLPTLLPLFNDRIELRVAFEADGGVTVEHRVPGSVDGLTRHGNELWVATLLARARAATGAAVRPRAVWFAHAAPTGVDVAVALAVPAPSFGAAASGLRFAAADVARPLRTSDPVLLGVLDRLIAPRLAVVGDRRGGAAEVSRAIDDGFADGLPTLPSVARTLGRSTRALQRELTDAGTSFRALLDQVRRVRARTLMAADAPLDEVAAQLGYSERSAFVRALGRWQA